MPRLLFLSERFPPDLGGLATSAGRVSASLREMGVEVDVLTWSRFLQPGEVKAEGNLYRIGLYRHWDMTLLHTQNVLDWLHQTHAYDAVWGHYLFPAGFVAVWFARQQGLPVTVSVRGNDLDREMFPPGDFARLQWTLSHATVVTTVSQNLAHKVYHLSGRDDPLLLKNAVDTQIFTPATTAADRQQVAALRRSLGIQVEETVLGFAGELREKKGQGFLLQALSAVRRQHPACLLIIGEVRPSQESVLQIYASQHPEDGLRVIVTGHLANPAQVARHLQLCDVYLQPSLWEGMPNALLEAMACGVGCIASDAGGIPEVLTHSETGFLIPRFQLQHLGDAILEWLALEESVRQTICQSARQHILTHYSLTQERACLQTLLRQLMR